MAQKNTGPVVAAPMRIAGEPDWGFDPEGFGFGLGFSDEYDTIAVSLEKRGAGMARATMESKGPGMVTTAKVSTGTGVYALGHHICEKTYGGVRAIGGEL